jgi:sulfate transport system permease protein
VADTFVATPAKLPSRGRDERRKVAAAGRGTLALVYVGLLVVVPVGALIYQALKPGLGSVMNSLNTPEAQHAFQETAIVAGSALVIDAVFGVAVAILLARYRFPGRRVLSALIDLPVAVSPIVVGLALILVFGPNGWLGAATGSWVIFANPGMVLATVFVSLPVVARAIIPVLEQAGTDQEQAAASLGANALARFLRITLPTIRVALVYGMVLALARCVGEFGAVLVVSGNVSGLTQTASLLVGDREQQLDQNGAYAIAFVLMLIALAAIVVGAYIRRRQKRGS